MPKNIVHQLGPKDLFFQLLALSSFGLAQPIFDLLSKNPGFFAVHRSEPIDLIALTIGLILFLPVLLFILDIIFFRVSLRLGNMVHSLFLVLLLSLVVLPVCDGMPGLQGWKSITFAVFVSIAGVVGYWRWNVVRSNLAILALATPVFVGLFLFSTGKSVIPASDELTNTSNLATTEVPIVVVIFDELPLASLLDDSGSLDGKLFPNFARLASVANWYPQATSISGATLKAVPAILTGRFSDWDQLPNLKGHPNSLFTLLGPTHNCVVQEVQTNLCPTVYLEAKGPVLHLRLKQLFADVSVLYKHIIYPEIQRSHLPPINNRWNNFNGSNGGQQVQSASLNKVMQYQQYVDSIQKSNRPLLAVSHVLLPHNPYRFYPDGSIHNWREGEGENLIGHRWVDDELILQHTFKRHLIQVSCTDRLLGSLLDRLENTGWFDDALIVVTADHGACFTPGQSHRHLTEENVHDIMSVPLLIKFPHQKIGEQISRNVQSIDIFPTILDYLEMKPEWEMDGVSFLNDAGSDRTVLDFLDQDKRVHRKFPVERVQDESQTIQWKRSEFSDVVTIDEMFSHGSDVLWLGQDTNSLPKRARRDLRAHLDFPERYEKINLDGVFIPGEITGVLTGWSSTERAKLAVAVNGVIAGFTDTYLQQEGKEGCAWSFLVPKQTFSSGKNEISVFIVSGEETEAVFYPLINETVFHQDTVFGGRAVYSVEESGFLKDEDWDGTPFRWTNGNATLAIPVGTGPQPQAVGFGFVSTGPQGTDLQILVNGEIFLQKHIPKGPWHHSLELPKSDGDKLVIEILSSTFTPQAEGTSGRVLGVGVSAVVLNYPAE